MWRYDPLRDDQGDEPFRARGLAYVGALRYVETRFTGGRDAFLSAMGPAAPFYEQIFVIAGDYPISPLLKLYKVAAEGSPIAAFIEERARWSGSSDSKGVWKPSLKGASAQDVAAKLDFAFNRYFPPCTAEPLKSEPEMFQGELKRIPACMNGLYAHSTVGFYRGALEGAAATSVHLEWEKPVLMGTHGGTTVERLRFTARWKLK